MKFKKGQVYRDPFWDVDDPAGHYVVLGVKKNMVTLKWFINDSNYRGDRLIEMYDVKRLEGDILVSEKLAKIQRIIWEID